MIKNRLDVRYVIPYLLHSIKVIFSLILGTTENRETITEHLHNDICPMGITYLKNALPININITPIPLFLTLRFFNDLIHIARLTCIYITLANIKHPIAWYTRFSLKFSMVLDPTCINSKYLSFSPPIPSSEFHLILILRISPLVIIHPYNLLSNEPLFHI